MGGLSVRIFESIYREKWTLEEREREDKIILSSTPLSSLFGNFAPP
jgi:hypothetical protein